MPDLGELAPRIETRPVSAQPVYTRTDAVHSQKRPFERPNGRPTVLSVAPPSSVSNATCNQATLNALRIVPAALSSPEANGYLRWRPYLTMDLFATLASDLHGEFIGDDREITCDFPTPHRRTIDPAEPICYEAIRVIASPTLDGRLPVPSGWHLDMARCEDHEVSILTHRTIGFDEVLITLEVELVEEVAYTVDGRSIRLIDRSPPDEGAQPVEAPPAIAAAAVRNEEYGFDRLSTRAAYLPVYRLQGSDTYVEELTAAIEESSSFRGTPWPDTP